MWWNIFTPTKKLTTTKHIGHREQLEKKINDFDLYLINFDNTLSQFRHGKKNAAMQLSALLIDDSQGIVEKTYSSREEYSRLVTLSRTQITNYENALNKYDWTAIRARHVDALAKYQAELRQYIIDEQASIISGPHEAPDDCDIELGPLHTF